MTYRVIYSSQANAEMSVADLERILVDARAGNEARGITGALVYVEGVFVQILEGERDRVQDLVRSIARDSRHSAVTVFHEAQVERPLFASWRMAFVSATPDQLAQWSGLAGTATLEQIRASLQGGGDGAARVATGILEALSR